AAAAGMDITITHPPGYDLNAAILDRARSWSAAHGRQFDVTHDQMAACGGADVVYAKSWGSPALYGQPDAQRESVKQFASWMITPRHLARPTTLLMHCLPVRRNVVIADAALDDPRCIVVDQAENRLWAQTAILSRLFGQES